MNESLSEDCATTCQHLEQDSLSGAFQLLFRLLCNTSSREKIKPRPLPSGRRGCNPNDSDEGEREVKEVVFYEKKSFKHGCQFPVSSGNGMQQCNTCTASKHETNIGYFLSYSSRHIHNPSTFACASYTPFAGQEFPLAPIGYSYSCHLSGYPCLCRLVRETRARRCSMDSSSSLLVSRHGFPLFCGANLSSNASLSTLTYRRGIFRRQKYEDPLDSGRS
jgi:hypothetical protein